jgi:hypothetical protein
MTTLLFQESQDSLTVDRLSSLFSKDGYIKLASNLPFCPGDVVRISVFYIAKPGSQRFNAVVAMDFLANKYFKTVADSDQTHELLSLPPCPYCSEEREKVMSMAQSQEMIEKLKGHGPYHGFALLQTVVVIVGPGTPFSVYPTSFGKGDLERAINAGLLERRLLSGSFELEIYAVKPT